MNVQILRHSEIHQLTNLQPDNWPDIIPHVGFYTLSDFCHPIKVMMDETIVGIGTTIVHHNVAWLAHIIVHKDYRKRGIGQHITEILVDSARSEKCETIYLIATDLGAPVYEKVGFETETEYLFFKDVKIENNIRPSHNIIPYAPIFNEQIADLDKKISAEERMFHLESHLSQGYVYTNNFGIEGFYLPTFGDGLILANSPAAGLDLLQFHLSTNDKVVLPKENEVVVKYLHDHGFNQATTGKRMRLGKERNVQFQNIYNRIGGNLG